MSYGSNDAVIAMAAAMWRHEATSGTPESVANRRTPEAFMTIDPSQQDKWLGLAVAAYNTRALDPVVAELVEALDRLITFVEAHSMEGEVIPPHTVEHERARAAIAKAKGNT